MVANLLRKHKISWPTFCMWKKKSGRVAVPELHRPIEVERENSRLKRMYAEQAL